MTFMQKLFWFIALVLFPASIYIASSHWAPAHFISLILGLYVVVGIHDLWFSPHTLNRRDVIEPVLTLVIHAV